MENNKADRRVARTRMALIYAFGSLIHERCNLERIRISDVLERANVGRSTFYEHFRNKEEGLAASLEPFLSSLARTVDAKQPTAALIQSLDGWWSLREQARMIFGGSSRRIVRKLLAKSIAEQLSGSELARSCDRSALRLTALALAEGQVGTLHAWFAGELTCTSIQLAAALAHIARASSGRAMSNASNGAGATRAEIHGPFEHLTPELACEALATIGVDLTPGEVALERRENRWLARLPRQRVAWFAACVDGHTQLMRERSVLHLLAERCSFRVPRIVAIHPIEYFQVRDTVPGTSDPFAVYASLCKDKEAAKRYGISLARMLAEQHTRIQSSDVAGWLPRHPCWPEPSTWIRERLPSVVDDAELIAAADDVLAAYESVSVAKADRVLVHTDLGPHNVSVDPASFSVQGIFDYEAAVWADRHHDFRYLVLENHEALLDAAIGAYEPITGRTIQRDRVRLYNAACAISYLAFRIGRSPDESWCGRTLAEDLEWSRRAIRACGFRIRS